MPNDLSDLGAGPAITPEESKKAAGLGALADLGAAPALTPEEAIKSPTFDPVAHVLSVQGVLGDAHPATGAALDFATQAQILRDSGLGYQKPFGERAWEGIKDGAGLAKDAVLGVPMAIGLGGGTLLSAREASRYAEDAEAHEQVANDPAQLPAVREDARQKAVQARADQARMETARDRGGATAAAALETSAQGTLGLLGKVGGFLGNALSNAQTEEGGVPLPEKPHETPEQQQQRVFAETQERLRQQVSLATARQRAKDGHGELAAMTGQATPEELARRGAKPINPEDIEKMAAAASGDVLALGPAMGATGRVLSAAGEAVPALGRAGTRALDVVESAARQIPGRAVQVVGSPLEGVGRVTGSPLGSRIIGGVGGLALGSSHGGAGELFGALVGSSRHGAAGKVAAAGRGLARAGQAVREAGGDFASGAADASTAGAAGEAFGAAARQATQSAAEAMAAGSPLALLDDDPVRTLASYAVPGAAMGLMRSSSPLADAPSAPSPRRSPLAPVPPPPAEPTPAERPPATAFPSSSAQGSPLRTQQAPPAEMTPAANDAVLALRRLNVPAREAQGLVQEALKAGTDPGDSSLLLSSALRVRRSRASNEKAQTRPATAVPNLPR